MHDEGVRRKKYPVCDKCGNEIDPIWDGCERYFQVGKEVCCEECFRDWVRDWMETNLEDVAATIGVPVVEVR